MSLDNITLNNQFIIFKNDLLTQVKKTEEEMNRKITQLQTSLQDNSNNQKNQFEKISNNIKGINSLLVARQLDDEKIQELINMKQKIDSQFLSTNTKLSNIDKDLQQSINKYDRIILDNLEIPGLIGKSCKYKFLNLFLEDMNKEISNLQLFKEKQSIYTQTYKEKMETLIQNMDYKIKELNQTTIQLCESKFAEAKIDIEKRCKITEELIQILRIENGKSALELIKNTDRIKVDWEKLENLQNDINSSMEKKIKYYENIVEENTKSYLKMEDEFKILKQKFTQLAEFIRDIRFQKNILNKKKFFENAALNIDFRKKQKFRDDYDMTLYDKIGDDVIDFLQYSENNFIKNNNQHKNSNENLNKENNRKRKSMLFRGEMNEKKNFEKTENNDKFIKLVKNSDGNYNNYYYSGSGETAKIKKNVSDLSIDINKKDNKEKNKENTKEEIKLSENIENDNKKENYICNNIISFSLLGNDNNEQKNKTIFTSPKLSKRPKQLIINENVTNINYLSDKKKPTENDININNTQNIFNNFSKYTNNVNNRIININKINNSKNNNSTINNNIRVIPEIQKDKINTIKNIFDYSKKSSNSHNLHKANKTSGIMKLKSKLFLEERKENNFKEMSNIVDKEYLINKNTESKSVKNEFQNENKNIFNHKKNISNNILTFNNESNSNTFLLTEIKDKKFNNINEDIINKKMRELEKNFLDLTQKISEINKTISYFHKIIENNKVVLNHKLNTNVCKLESSISNIKYIISKTRMAKFNTKNNESKDEEVSKKLPQDESNILLRKIEPFLIKKFIKNS